MFKTSHFDVSKFGFLLLYSFRAENLNGMLNLPQTTRRFENGIVLESGVKLELRRIFLYERGKVREK
jgi:hypothetical protein